MMVGEHQVAEDPPGWPAPAGHGRRLLRQDRREDVTDAQHPEEL